MTVLRLSHRVAATGVATALAAGALVAGGASTADAAVSGGLVPDLRYSTFLGNDQWFAIVLDGALKDAGMAGFKSSLNRNQAEAIRAYVIARANQDKAPPEAAPAPGTPTEPAPAQPPAPHR